MASAQDGTAGRTKLWQIGASLHPLVEKYTVGEDHIIDGRYMLPHDVNASTAHAKMLQKIGVVTEEECRLACQGLQEIKDLWNEGKFHVDASQEDCHTAIEQFLTEKYGDVGKKIHTGRSRNDQSLVMIRLFANQQLSAMIASVKSVEAAFAELSEKNKDIPMPGYTHMQRAMPSSVGLWADSYRCALQDGRAVLQSVLQNITDQNPLGSAAGFGVNHLKLDRAATTEHLGFARTQENVAYCGLSRGMFESTVLAALASCVITPITRFAVDMMAYTQGEFKFFSLPKEFTTGSSIMPQKRNYDVFEIMRANGRVFTSHQQSVQGIVMSLGSGYHRDLQLTKKHFVEAMQLCGDTLTLLSTLLANIQVNEKRLRQVTDPSSEEGYDLYVTDMVYERVAKGELFRDAYLSVKEAYAERLEKRAQEDAK